MSVFTWHRTVCQKAGALFGVVLFTLFATISVSAAGRGSASDQAFSLESSGDLTGARTVLERQAKNGSDPAAAEQLARFLDRHGDPGRREAYLGWAGAERDPAKQRSALRQAVLLDFESGQKTNLTSDLGRYQAAGGADLSAPARNAAITGTYSMTTIPGPLASFARMAALAPDLQPEELLPALARNIVTSGYEASANEFLQQTEYLRLLTRYMGQARELQALANSKGKIVVPQCDSEQTGTLLRTLGYRMRGSCGADIVLETVNPSRAFLTVDSGFPLTELESDLRANHAFEVPFAPTPIPVLYNAEYWLAALGRRSQNPEFIDAFISDPSLCRLYLGLSHLDHTTREVMRKQAPATKLKLYANVLDFYGGMFQVRNGAAVVPGSARGWTSLVGSNPNNAGAFFERLISIDDGWMASYFDAVSRLNNNASVAYLSAPERMRHFYEALKGKYTSPGPARPVFRSSTDLLLLTTSLTVNANGEPHVPGNLDVWRTLFIKHPHGKYDGKLTRSANTWRTGDDLMEALFALSRKPADNEPLKIFLALNDIDRNRAKPLSVDLTARLINSYRMFGAQYRFFVDAPALSERSIVAFLDVCEQLNGVRDVQTRADAVGSLQALVELWDILGRQNSISPADQDAAFLAVLGPFGKLKGEAEVFNADHTSLDALLNSAHVGSSGTRQEKLLDLLVGKVRNYSSPGVQSPAEGFLRIYDAQMLLTVDQLIDLADQLGKGSVNPKLLKPVSEQLNRIAETQSSRGDLSPQERNAFALGYWSTRHIEQEQKFNLPAVLKSPDKKDARALLAPFLRDSLLGLVYSYYAPDGGQALLANPQFVRSHDFVGSEGGSTLFWKTTEVSASGWPTSAGGRLSGSLIALPYALAQAEQNFLSPRKEQALIWADLVPQMIINVTVPRYRSVSADQMRWVSLRMERGRDLIALAGLNAPALERVSDSLHRLLSPENVDEVETYLHSGNYARAIAHVPPAVIYALAADPHLNNLSSGPVSVEIESLTTRCEAACSDKEIARVFGTPKPTLTHSYQPDLLYLRTFPALMGFSSRILAETWESNNLFYAALADQVGIPANELDAYVPEWNRSAIENIFATHLEDWPALIRSLTTTAEIVSHANSQRASLSSSVQQQ